LMLVFFAVAGALITATSASDEAKRSPADKGG